MNDRELLELAATAAGFVDFDWLSGDDLMNVYQKDGKHKHWNPLTDDGDALRLAVKLGIELVFTRNKIGAGRHSTVSYLAWVNEDRRVEDPYASTRRAIVRAAAEIGKNMK